MAAVLQANGLSKRFGSLTAVDNLSLEVFEGEVFGFLGPNGAGKTTSISMMTGLLKPDRGEVLVHGKQLSSGDKLLRSRVGICPQEIILWERLTCLEQLTFSGEMFGLTTATSRKRAQELLRTLDLDDRKNTQARFLSGGMKRRLNLLMALVHDPDIVVLDEPEAGLDPQSRLLVRDFIRSLARRKTVIFTTHNMDEAERVTDRLAIIDRGKLLVTGSVAEVKKQYGGRQTLEVQIKGVLAPDLLDGLKAAFTRLDFSLTNGELDPRLEISGEELTQCFAPVISYLNSREVPLGEVRLRESTLEDVFIRLTGRRLRE